MSAALRIPRLLAAAALVAAAPVCVAPHAVAVTPPPLDDSRLPAAGPAAPPRPTVQDGDCVAAPPLSLESTDPGQLKGVDLQTVWRLTRGAGQTVAVIDTGVARHQRLPHLVPGGDYVSTGDGATDCDGHGTIVAGIIGAATDSADPDAFTGIAPDATLLGVRQASNRFHAVADPSGSGFGDVETLASAVRGAADLGATVINISSVACVPAGDDLDDRALGAALAYAVDVKNVVVVTAAGNVGGPGQCPADNDAADWDDVTVVASPAWYDEYVLTVGSLGADGTASTFSLSGPWVDVAAPGEGVVSLASSSEGLVDSVAGQVISGTSYAAPVVSAIAALVRARSPELTARQVMARIEDTARHPAGGWNPAVGHGMVDALAAVSGTALAAPPSPSSPQPVQRADSGTGTERPPSRTALQGAAVCFALTAGIVVVSTAAGRLRRRDEAVPGD